MNNDLDPSFNASVNPITEPNDDAIGFWKQDEKYSAGFFPFREDLSDFERKTQVKAWIKSNQPYLPFQAVTWITQSGKIELFDLSMNPIPINDCIFDVNSLSPEVALKDAVAIKIYKDGMKGYWEQLIRLNTNLVIIKKLSEFPLFALATRDKTVFLTNILRNTIDISIVLLNGLLNDPKDNQTIPRFRNLIDQNLIRPEFQQSFRKHLKQIKKEINLKVSGKNLLTRLNDLRNTVIAHFLEWRLTGNYPANLIEFDFSELETLFDITNQMFHSLTFNVQYIAHKPEYDPNIIHSKPHQTDIDDILDDIAKRSFTLNMPEKNSVLWQSLKPNLTPRQLEALNQYRVKFGLSTI